MGSLRASIAQAVINGSRGTEIGKTDCIVRDLSDSRSLPLRLWEIRLEKWHDSDSRFGKKEEGD